MHDNNGNNNNRVTFKSSLLLLSFSSTLRHTHAQPLGLPHTLGWAFATATRRHGSYGHVCPNGTGEEKKNVFRNRFAFRKFFFFIQNSCSFGLALHNHTPLAFTRRHPWTTRFRNRKKLHRSSVVYGSPSLSSSGVITAVGFHVKRVPERELTI